VKAIRLIYPADREAIENCATLAASTGMSLDDVSKLIDPANASGEIIRHIMLEAFLELNEDIEALFRYCEEMFTKEQVPHLLAKGYLLRLPMLSKMKGCPILLTNEYLSRFLELLPVETTTEGRSIDIDVVAWEIFRQIVSPRLDPLNAERVQLISDILRNRQNEVERLRRKCTILAEQVERTDALEKLQGNIASFVRSHVEKEIGELLGIDRQALDKFLTSVFADEKTWLAFFSFISGMISNQIIITTGGAIGALSSLSAKAFKTAADRRQKLKNNDFTLIYRLPRTPA
jgi:hypothetical protein